MSKPLIASVVRSPSVEVTTDDGTQRLVLDQGAPDVGILARSLNKNVRISSDPADNVAVELVPDGSIFVFTPAGNAFVTASQILLDGDAQVRLTLLDVSRSVVLDPADPLYEEINNLFVPGLNVVSRLDIVPAAGGTTINSMIVDSGSPNPDGRQVWIQNLGTDPLQTLTLSYFSPTGTAGGLFSTPGGGIGIVIPLGGGVSAMFDSNVSPDGAWVVRANSPSP